MVPLWAAAWQHPGPPDGLRGALGDVSGDVPAPLGLAFWTLPDAASRGAGSRAGMPVSGAHMGPLEEPLSVISTWLSAALPWPLAPFTREPMARELHPRFHAKRNSPRPLRLWCSTGLRDQPVPGGPVMTFHEAGRATPPSTGGDPAAGSPTATLLRLLPPWGERRAVCARSRDVFTAR